MKEKLKKDVLKLYKELDRTPTSTEFNNKYKSIGAVNYHFKSWNNLLKYADIPITRGISKEETINRMIELSKELQRTPTLEEFFNKYRNGGIYKNFNSYNELIKSSGLKVNQGYTKKELKEILINQTLELGRIPNLTEFAKDKKPKPDIYNYFENWYEFLKYCNIEKELENTFIDQGDHYKIIVYGNDRNRKNYILIDKNHKNLLENKFINWNKEVGASISDYPSQPIRLSEFIYGTANDEMIYIFKNKDNRDYRCENIKLVSVKEKLRENNLRLDNKTGVKGVFWNKKKARYQVSIGVEGRTKYIGLFDNLQDATEARLIAEKEYWGKIYQEEIAKEFNIEL